MKKRKQNKSASKLLHANKIGVFPSLKLTPFSMLAVSTSFALGAGATYYLSSLPVASITAGLSLTLGAWVAERYTRFPDHDSNEGYHPLTDPPPNKKARKGMMDSELTATYRSVYKDESIVVNREDASQYYVHVIHHDDTNITSRLGVLARKLNIQSIAGKKGADSIPVIFFEVYRAGCSALLIQKRSTDWGKPVGFDKSAIVDGQPIAYIGKSIDGQNITINHKIEHGVLVSGASGSGKTEVFVVHHKSLIASGLNPLIYILDLKGTAQLKRLKSDIYIAPSVDEDGVVNVDIEAVYDFLAELSTDLAKRMNKYTEANCDNIWDYRKKVDDTERPISLYIDELSVLSRAARSAENGSRIKKIMDVVAGISQLGRSSGLVEMVGMQQPLAEDIPTSIRAQLMARVVLSVENTKAAEIAGIVGAENQPMQGAMMVKHCKQITIGRGAYIQS